MWRRGIHNYIPIFLRRRGFNPLSLSPELWLDASYGTYQSAGGSAATADTDPVGEWQDQSGNDRHAAQATAANRPLLKLNIQNGMPVLRFDGASNFLQVASLVLAQPSIIFAVSKFAVTNATQFVYDGKADGSRHSLLMENSNDWRISAGTEVASADLADTNFHITSALFNGASSSLRLDGAEILSGNAGANSLTGLNVGASFEPSLYLNGDIGEILVCNASLSAAEIERVEEYLNDRWAIF